MSIFRPNYNKPGPGVPKNAPKKKGIKRYFEILGRSFWDLVKLNLLEFLCFLPAMLLFGMALLELSAGGLFWFLIFSLLAVLLSFPVGGALATQASLLTKMLRDEPFHLWHEFKKDFKSNFRPMMLPGMIYSLILGLEIVAGFYYFVMLSDIGIAMTVLYVLSALLFSMTAPYFFMQGAYLDLKPGAMLKNSILLALSNAPRSLVAAVVNVVLIGVQFLYIYLGFIVTITFGVVLVRLVSTMWIWPFVDKTFKIDETLKKRHSGEIDAAIAEWETGAEQQEAEPAPPEQEAEADEEEEQGEKDSGIDEYGEYSDEEMDDVKKLL